MGLASRELEGKGPCVCVWLGLACDTSSGHVAACMAFWPLTLMPILSPTPQLSCLSSSLPGEPSSQGGEWWSQDVTSSCDTISETYQSQLG